ncbi:ABC transporter ATP-binding protein [Hanamia caeni]|uniref:ABC transporter ATP-binding protein n=1 Tax=Hanamia caeni TaxID=2294116 RepID=A0A3M9NFR9_9BACT|nr:ABC transporter ATP-binding protein [Hanamia caeni]RNI36571.1 ABC transporter ATP-binding protein [Hanamia caeni]
MPLLQIKDFSVDFVTDSGVTSAVQNISFEINRGETVAIVGESGSGKTVTSLSILKLLPSPPARYSSGQILFSQEGKNETDIVKLDEKSIQKIRGNQISMVFQEPMTSLNPVKTCGKQVMEAIRTHYNISKKEARKRTISLFEKVKLPDPQSIVDRYPHEISGGQKQRVMIAMAISCNPSLLIADEPTTALDVTVQKTILQLIKDLQKEQNMSVIYITHDLGLVSEIADRVIVMYKGKVVESGPIKEIFLDPQNPYTKALLACRPDSSAKGKRLPVVGDFLEDAGGDAKPETIFSKAPRNDHFDAAQTILSVENLKVYFPVKRNFFGKILKVFKAVDDVSFEVKKGETVGLVGESGCGKTTLGRSILRLIEPTSGAIYLNDKNIGNIPEGQFRKMRKDIQIIFQDPYGSLNPRLTIGEAINEPMKIHGILPNQKQRKEKIIDLLEKVDLKSEYFNRYPHEFSGGQRQRICIARALGLNPEFIICDESVSALDVSVQAQVLNLLSELKEELGFSSVFISHDLGVVHYISDRIIVMNKGKIEEEGAADAIYFNPQKEYTQRLIAAIPKVRL